LSKEQYEEFGDETTSCWLEDLLYYIKKEERGEVVKDDNRIR
jgi:hypothetical protein